MPYLLIILSLVLLGCSGLEQSEQEKIRRQNATAEFIHRESNDPPFDIPLPKHRIRDKYPWENTYVGKHLRITKEFFRCKGNPLNTPRKEERIDGVHLCQDCAGCEKHSLPIIEDQEFIYPILIELLNYVQEKTEKKVVITCGHRCPAHNLYADPSPFNQGSKHMIGAEVDFYVEGLEEQPQKIVDLLINYYKNQPEYREFKRYEGTSLNVALKPWCNKEILIKLYQRDEGRDLDNLHPYPYIGVQVRYDRNRKDLVKYDDVVAQKGYRRY